MGVSAETLFLRQDALEGRVLLIPEVGDIHGKASAVHQPSGPDPFVTDPNRLFLLPGSQCPTIVQFSSLLFSSWV
jgi:hypothetical protein